MDPDKQESLKAAIDALWTRFQPEMLLRVATLEAAAAAFATGQLAATEREAAHAAAHKLAGSLGSFGLTRGTELARELETAYARAGGPYDAMTARLGEVAAELRAIVHERK